MYLVVLNRIGTGTIYLGGSNKSFNSRFSGESRVRHETLEEGERTCWVKHYDYNNKEEVNSPNILNDNNNVQSI